MSDDYQGMQWFKCDLQVQTPEDNTHWADDDLRLGDPRRPKVEGNPSEQGIAEKARVFLNRCHELELDIIGITDHNFSQKTDPRDWFLTHLVEQNKDVARAVGRAPLVIFPGFEVDIGYHVLCLFPAANKQFDIENCNRYLTKLGLSEVERFDRSQPKLLRKGDESVSLKTLINHVQGEMGGIVIAAHSDQASGMLEQAKYREDFSHPELYCVEVTQNPPTQKYRTILQGKDPNWKRHNFYPAYIMSSDAKSLKVDKDGNPKPNSLGYRYTWFKMSRPSIESLRQAFLDAESRIKLPEDVVNDLHPEQSIKHSRIKSIKVEGVEFLENQEVHFSPNKNSFIGGRGSGKSTLQEYLRIVLGKDKEGSVDKNTREKIDRIKNTLRDNSKLIVRWVSDAQVEDEIIWEGGEIKISGLDQASVATYLKNLPVQFFSQQQLNQLTETEKTGSGLRQSERLLELIDAFDQDILAKLREKESLIKSDLEVAFSQQRQIEAMKSKGEELSQEYAELERQWKARSKIQQDATKHQQVKSAESSIEKYKLSVATLEDDLEVALSKFDEKNLIVQDESPFVDLFKAFENKHRQEKAKLLAANKKALEDYKKNIDNFLSSSDDWTELIEKVSTADEAFHIACERLGLSEEDANQLQDAVNQKNKKQQEVESNQQALEKITAQSLSTVALISELHGVWREQFKQREAAADKANELVEQGGKKFLVSSVHYQQSERSFNELWDTANFKPNGRTRLGRNWPDFGKNLHKAFIHQNTFASPLALLDSLLLDERPEEALSVLFKGCETELIEHLKDKAKEWEVIKTSRIEDVVDLELYRSDGTLAGSIAKNSLSDGQRNTAALVLVLAHGDGPLVIDQPEDELDSNFVSKELIPMLRKVKPNRQLILATHNANLPVNGDSELVYAFEAKDGRGNVRASGGLDRKEVTHAILDVMEGSKEAFDSRREKYGF